MNRPIGKPNHLGEAGPLLLCEVALLPSMSLGQVDHWAEARSSQSGNRSARLDVASFGPQLDF
jgi:hypothetical protein